MLRKTAFISTQDINSVYEFKKKIDEGAYGNVYKAIGLEDNLKVAIKHLKTLTKRVETLKEVQVLSMIRHPNVVFLKEVVTIHSGDVFLVYEYLETNLLKYYSIFAKKVLVWIRFGLFSYILSYLSSKWFCDVETWVGSG